VPDIPDPLPVLFKRVDIGVQTVRAWQMQYKNQQRRYYEQKLSMKREMTKARRSRSRMYRKYQIKGKPFLS